MRFLCKYFFKGEYGAGIEYNTHRDALRLVALVRLLHWKTPEGTIRPAYV
jgi:hypothetical protein